MKQGSTQELSWLEACPLQADAVLLAIAETSQPPLAAV
jgi:hypothetical protein